MLETELTTSAKNVTENGVLPKTDKQADIVRRLEELNKWNEEQKKLLEVKQTMQRKKLGVEHKAIYKKLGFKSESEITLVEQKDTNMKEYLVWQDGEEQLEEYVDESVETSQIEEQLEDDFNEDYGDENFKHLTQTRPKRPFLRRGEGLRQRFKIDPDEFRLYNLPRYKYANAHPNLRLKTSNIRTDKNTKADNCNQQLNVKAKTPDELTSLDACEQRFQNLLISSKHSCSSTPEAKSSFVACKAPACSQNNILGIMQRDEAFMSTNSNDANRKQTTVSQVMAWSKILDPLEIEPLQVPRTNKQTLPQTEESIFELLEQKAQEGSFDMESTCLQQFMTRRITEKLNEIDDNIPVKEQLKYKRLEPLVLTERLPQEHSSRCSSDESVEEFQTTEELESTSPHENTHKTVETNSTLNQQTSHARVRFSDSNETHEYEEEPDTTVTDTSRLSAGLNQPVDPVDINNSDFFLQFKEALVSALQVKADEHVANDCALNYVCDTTLTDKNTTSVSNNYDISNSNYTPACKDLQEKTEVIKMRLAELEKEIKFFKENNILLLKAKQEHELQKSFNAQEHLEAMDSLKDEKIRMEIYLHDERIKLEDEKRQFEQNVKIKTQGLIAKERKECERLKEQLSQMEIQLKTKESNHTAAQARLRTQIRNMEREQSKLHEKVESLLRENKKLENENLRISREQNNKILHEINRNIAKLAPKQILQSTTSIPDEGPPTFSVSKTVSKCIVAAATANKNSAKPYKTTSTRFSNRQKQANYKKPPSTEDEEMETVDETSLLEENKQCPETNLTEEDQDDILKEFHLTPEKRNNRSIKTKLKNSSPNKSLSKGQKQEPVPPPSSPRSSAGMNMKREIVNADGSKDIWYPNGNLKKICPDGMKIRMLYYNKDIKETNINEGTVKYYYAETNTWHTSYLDGLEILEFPNGQIEHRHKNGVVEVHYPNNSVKIINPKDEHKQEEWRFADGTHLVQMHNGDKILSLPNGQKEIHNKLHKRREYPDGTVKIVYPDGSTETRYSNGRVRLKDKEGKLVMDTDMAK